VKFPPEGTCVEVTDEYGNTDRGVYRGIMPGKPTGGSVFDRADKHIIDSRTGCAHIPVQSVRRVKRIPGGMAQFMAR
jgi:hypothetical protein